MKLKTKLIGILPALLLTAIIATKTVFNLISFLKDSPKVDLFIVITNFAVLITLILFTVWSIVADDVLANNLNRYTKIMLRSLFAVYTIFIILSIVLLTILIFNQNRDMGLLLNMIGNTAIFGLLIIIDIALLGNQNHESSKFIEK